MLGYHEGLSGKKICLTVIWGELTLYKWHDFKEPDFLHQIGHYMKKEKVS